MRKTVRTLLLIVLCTLLASCGGKKEKDTTAASSVETAENQESAQGQSGLDNRTDNSGTGLPVESVLTDSDGKPVAGSGKDAAVKGARRDNGSTGGNAAGGNVVSGATQGSASAASGGGAAGAVGSEDVSRLPEYPVASTEEETEAGEAVNESAASVGANQTTTAGDDADATASSSPMAVRMGSVTKKQEPQAPSNAGTRGAVSSSSSTVSRAQARAEAEAQRRAEADARAQAKREAAERKEAERQAERERKAALEAEVNAARSAAGSGLIHTGSAPYASLWGENSTQGSSDIEIIAPRNKDVVVIIRQAKTNDVVRHAYVARGETCVLTLPEGFYQTFFYYGTHWSARKEIKPGMMGGFRYGETYDKDRLRKLPAGIVRTYDLSSSEEETETVPSNAEEMF